MRRGIFAAELASRNFPNGIGGFARPSDLPRRHGDQWRRGRRGCDRQSRCPPDGGIRQCGAALGGGAYASRHPDFDARGVAARLRRARSDELSASDCARQHLGSRARHSSLLGCCTRGARPRSHARPCAGSRYRPRSALGPNRGDLRRGPVSLHANGPGGDPRLSGSHASLFRPTRCSSR